MRRKGFLRLCLGVILGTLPVAWGGECEVESSGVVVDVRQDLGGRLVRGEAWVSPVADAASEVPVLHMDGQLVAGWSSQSPRLDVRSVEDGWHELTLSEDGRSSSVSLAVVNNPQVVLHGGELAGDERWSGDKVHVVRHLVRVPSGVTLTIERGAVVKFCRFTELAVEGVLQAQGVTFTSVQDDSVGGDTDMMAVQDDKVQGDYGLTGTGTFNLSDCVLRYRTGGMQFFTLTLTRGWNLVSLPSRVWKNLGNERLLGRFNPFGFHRQGYVRAMLPLERGTVLWLYSTREETISFMSAEEIVDPAVDVSSKKNGVVGVPGRRPMKVPKGLAQTVWTWADGRFELKAPDADGGFTLEPGGGYLVY